MGWMRALVARWLAVISSSEACPVPALALAEAAGAVRRGLGCRLGACAAGGISKRVAQGFLSPQLG
jgi:hypothetical protein